MANVASVKSDLGRGQNGYLRIILLTYQYDCVSNTTFVRPPDPGKNVKSPSMDSARGKEAHPMKKRRAETDVIRVHNRQHHPEESSWLVLRRPIPLHAENYFTGYVNKFTIELITHLYNNYTRISATDIAANGGRLCVPYNAEEPLESLIERINECTDFATASSEPVSETQLVRISYRLVAETRQ